MSDDEGTVEGELKIVIPATQAKIWFVRFRIVASSISLFLRLTASFIVAAYEGWIKRKYGYLKRFKDRVKLEFMSAIVGRLSSLTDAVIYRGKIESVIHFVNHRSKIKWLSRKGSVEDIEVCIPEKSVNCEVLFSPDGEIRADVIFIHGLHGSIVHTWKQGLWSYRKQVKNTQLFHLCQPTKSEAIQKDCDKMNPECESKSADFSDPPIKTNCVKSGEEHDAVLENITDIINNIGDRMKEAKTRQSEDEEQNTEPYSSCWPRDWLPKDCPGVRVIAVNYTTDPFLWRPVWITKRIRTSMTQRSEEMEDHLLKLGVGQNPIVWVGHSKGGLFVKQLLVDAHYNENSRLKKLVYQTKAIMFYSVPHRGSSLAHINLPFLRQSIELTEVKKDCQEVLSLHSKFMKLYEENVLTAEVFSFVETILTFMFIANVRVVSIDSADIGFGVFRGVNIDHREICKPLSRDCFLYRELANLINRVT